MIREPGFYWIRRADDRGPARWEPAEYRCDQYMVGWELLCDNRAPYRDEDLIEIGPALAHPTPGRLPMQVNLNDEREAVSIRAEVVRDIDVPKGAWPWIEEIALALDGPHRRLETPNDAETIVLWYNEQPAAFVLNLRDQFNQSIQYRVDLRTKEPSRG